MIYYVIEISTGDAKIAGKGTYEYPSKRLAVANFHSKMGTAMKSDMYETELLMVIDANGKVIKRESYNRDEEESAEMPVA